MLSIADAFDAMVSKRPYRAGRSLKTATEVFRTEQHAGQWDPDLLDHFILMMTRMGAKVTEEWSNLQ
jgi:HD-GYP domain-containing protein (c-di-GMP phosphodiesterase class II)